MIYGLVIGLHLVVCVTLILVVLLQSGKGGGLAGAFGGMGGAGQSLFGGRGAATFLSKATTGLGIAFMVTSLTLAILVGHQSGPRSVVRDSVLSETAPPPLNTSPLQIPAGDALADPATGAGGQAPGGLDAQAPGTEPAAGGGETQGTGTPPEGNQEQN